MNKPIHLKSVCCFPLLCVQQDAWPSMVWCIRGVGDTKWPLCLLLIALNALTRLKFSNYLFLKICVKKKKFVFIGKNSDELSTCNTPCTLQESKQSCFCSWYCGHIIKCMFLTGAWQRDRIPESCQAGYRYSVFWQELHCAGVWGEHQVRMLVLLSWSYANSTWQAQFVICTFNIHIQ